MKKCTFKIIISLMVIVILCSSIYIPTPAASSSPNWVIQKQATCVYNGQNYRVTLYKDSNFTQKQVLFTSSPVYHTGRDVSYSLGFSKSQSDALSTTLGITIKTDVKAFGNGVSASLGISEKITTEYSTQFSETHEVMTLDGSDPNGYWAAYGYNNYSHYKIEVELECTKQVPVYATYTETYPTGIIFKKTKTRTVTVLIGYINVTYYTACSNYSGEFITSPTPDQIRLSYMFLGKK